MPEPETNPMDVPKEKAQEFFDVIADSVAENHPIPLDDRVPATCVSIEFRYKFECGCVTETGALGSPWAGPDGAMDSKVLNRCHGHQAEGHEVTLFDAAGAAFSKVLGLEPA